MAFSAEYIYRLIDKYSGPLARITQQTDQFRDAAKKVQDQARMMGDSLKNAGAKMTATLTLPIVGAGAAAMKTAIDFQSAFIGVQKTVDATAGELAIMNEQFIKMSTEIPVSATEIMGIGQAAGQLGIQKANIVDFTKTIAMLGATTNMAGEEGATQLARFANITQMNQKEFNRLGSTIVALGNNLATSESEIVSMAMRLAAAGHSVQMSEAQIMALAASLSSIGIEAEAGGTAFSKVMYGINNAVSKGGKELQKFAIVTGMSSDELSATFKKDAGQGILAFINGLQRMQKEGKNVNMILEALEFNDVRMKQALIGAAGAGDLFNRSMALGDKAWTEANALAREANLRFGSWSSQLTILWNKVKIVANEFGKVLVPVLISMLNLMMPIVNLFGKLPKFMKIGTVIMMGFVASIGPLLMAFGMMIPALTTLTTTILPWLIGTGLPMLLSGLSAVAAVLASITWPVWAIIGAIAIAAGIFYMAWQRSAKFRESIQNLGQALAPLIDGLRQVISMIMTGLSGAFSASGQEISSWGDIFIKVGDVLAWVIEQIAGNINAMFEGISRVGKTLGALSMGEFKDALNIMMTGKSKYDMGKGIASEKAAARQDNKLEVSGQIGVTATGGAKVEKASIGLNQGSNLAVVH